MNSYISSDISYLTPIQSPRTVSEPPAIERFIIDNNMDYEVDLLLSINHRQYYPENILPLEELLTLFIQNTHNIENIENMPTENMKTQLICLETSEELCSSVECDICYESRICMDMVVMNCNHTTCHECMKQVIRKKTCPFCREHIHLLTVRDPELIGTF